MAQYSTEDEVKDNFELASSVTSPQIVLAMAHADRKVDAILAAHEIATPQAKTPALTEAAVAFARAELRRLIAGTIGPGLGVQTVKEGDTEYRFASPDKQFLAYHQEGMKWMEIAIAGILGSVSFKTTNMNVPS